MGSPYHREYYALLNVDPHASQDAIRDAYLRLARTYHPDKCNPGAERETANGAFQLINRAYLVLSNVVARKAYDLFGPECPEILDLVGGEHRMVPATRSEDDIAKAYERHLRVEALKKLENYLSQSMDVELKIDAQNTGSRIRYGRPLILIDHLRARYCTEYQVMPVLKLGFFAGGLTNGKASNTDAGFFFKYASSGSRREKVTVRILPQPHVSLSSSFPIGGKYQRVVTTKFSSSPVCYGPPVFGVTYQQLLSFSRPLFLHCGFDSGAYSIGPWGHGVGLAGAVSAAGTHPNVSKRAAMMRQLINPTVIRQLTSGIFLGMHYRPPTPAPGSTPDFSQRVFASSQARISMMGLVINSQIGIPVTQRASLALHAELDAGSGDGTGTLELGVRTQLQVGSVVRLAFFAAATHRSGIVLGVEFTRLGQCIRIPLTIAAVGAGAGGDGNITTSLLSATLTAVVSGVLVGAVSLIARVPCINQLLGGDFNNSADSDCSGSGSGSGSFSSADGKPRMEPNEGRPRHDERALEMQKILKSIVRKRMAHELQRESDFEILPPSELNTGGLIVLRADYGIENHVMDPTVVLASMVRDGKLEIAGGVRKSDILGFFNPVHKATSLSLNVQNQLNIVYQHRKKLHYVVVGDEESVSCPNKAHILSDANFAKRPNYFSGTPEIMELLAILKKP